VSAPRAKVPSFSHETKIGEGGLPVICLFDFDPDGDFSVLQVWYGDKDIFRGLSQVQVEELESECQAEAEKDFAESKADAAIARFEADQYEVMA